MDTTKETTRATATLPTDGRLVDAAKVSAYVAGHVAELARQETEASC